MPTIINSVANQAESGATYTQAIPAGHQSGDLLVAQVFNGSTAGSAMTASGWTGTGVTTTAGSSRQQSFYKFATTSSEADLSVSGQDAQWVAVIHVIRGADATTPINQVTNADATSASSSLTSGTVTTTSNNCLMLHTWLYYSLGKATISDPDSLVNLVKLQHGSLNGGLISGYRTQAASGLSTAVTAIFERSSVTGRCFTLAIADATPSTPTLPPDSRNTYEVVKYHMGSSSATSNVDAFSRHESTTWYDFNSVTATTINGLSKISFTPSIGSTSNSDSPWGNVTQLSIGVSGIDATGRWVGAAHDFSVAVDFSGKISLMMFGMSSTSTVVGAEGVIVYFEDSAGEWAAFQMSDKNGIDAGKMYSVFIDVDTATPYDESGSIDWTDIVTQGYAYHRVGTSVAARILYLKYLIFLDNTIAFGGSADTPINPAFMNRLIEGWGASSTAKNQGLSDLQGTGQLILKSNIQYGDGANKSYTDLSATSTELIRLPNGTPERQYWQGSTDILTVGFNTSSSDILSINRSIIATIPRQTLNFNNGSAPSQFNTTGATLIGFIVTCLTGTVFSRVTFDSCYQITANTAGFSNCTISNNLATSAILTADPEGIVNTSFVSSGTGHAIEATATGTFAFEGNSFSGYGADGTTDAAFYNNSGGAITLTIPTGDDTPTIRNGAGASTTIVQPVENQKVTLNNLVIGSRVEVYDLTADTQLLNIIADATTEVWEDTNPYVADREIRLRVAYVDGDEAKEFIEEIIGTLTETDPQLTYRVNQVDDPVYNAHGVDGSTVTGITIDDDNLLIEVDTGSVSIRDIYAYETYWLFTETGIEDEGRAIIATDIANYAIYGFKLKNVTDPSVPLVITGGWVTDGDTGIPIDIIDTTGGDLFLAPDHVVAYAVGSGVAPQDIVDIWNYASRTLTGIGSSGIASQSSVDAVPTAQENADAVEAEIGDELEEILSNTDATQAKVNEL